MLTPTAYRDALIRPDSPEIGVLFPPHRYEFLIRQLTDRQPSSANTNSETARRQTLSAPKDVLVKLPSIRHSKWKVTVLQRWVGTIDQVFPDRVSAVIKDSSNPTNPAEQVEFLIDEISESDR